MGIVIIFVVRRRRNPKAAQAPDANFKGDSSYRTGVINPLYGNVDTSDQEGVYGEVGLPADDAGSDIDQDGFYQDVAPTDFDEDDNMDGNGDGYLAVGADEELGGMQGLDAVDGVEEEAGYLDVPGDATYDDVTFQGALDDPFGDDGLDDDLDDGPEAYMDVNAEEDDLNFDPADDVGYTNVAGADLADDFDGFGEEEEDDEVDE